VKKKRITKRTLLQGGCNRPSGNTIAGSGNGDRSHSQISTKITKCRKGTRETKSVRKRAPHVRSRKSTQSQGKGGRESTLKHDKWIGRIANLDADISNKGKKKEKELEPLLR